MLCCGVVYVSCFFFFKQKTAYEMRISDWSSDVCSSDLVARADTRRVETLDARQHGLDKRQRHAEPLREIGEVGAQIARLVDQRDNLFGDHRLDAREAFADLRQQMLVAIGRASCRERVCQYV